MSLIITPENPKPVEYIPNYVWRLNYDFEYEQGGSLQYDVGSLLDTVRTNSKLESNNAFSTASASLESYAPHNLSLIHI